LKGRRESDGLFNQATSIDTFVSLNGGVMSPISYLRIREWLWIYMVVTWVLIATFLLKSKMTRQMTDVIIL